MKKIWHLAQYIKGIRLSPTFQTKYFMSIRLAWHKVNKIDPYSIGSIMAGAFPEPATRIELFRNPMIIDAPEDVCLGWLLYSTHKMHSADYTKALVKSLLRKNIKIDPSQIGLTWQAISQPNGKRPQWIRNADPNPSALHLYVAKDYEHLIRRAIGEIYATPKSKGAGKLYPQKVMVRIIPCYKNKQTQILDPALRSEIARATDFQLYFNTVHIKTIEFTGITALGRPLSNENPVTLREIIMSLAPNDNPRKRIFQSVDTDWKSHSKCHFTTVDKMFPQALDMVLSLIHI